MDGVVPRWCSALRRFGCEFLGVRPQLLGCCPWGSECRRFDGEELFARPGLAIALAAADLYVCDRQSQCELLGELHHALAAGAVKSGQRYPELGQIIAGQAPGRPSAEAVTLCDLTGTGVQDTAIATLARGRAVAKGAGTGFES